MKKLFLQFLFPALILGWCTTISTKDAEILQKQIDEIKQIPSIQQQLTPLSATIVSDDPQIGSKIDQLKKVVFSNLKYTIVSSSSAEWKKYIDKFWAKYLPLMITWDSIKSSEIKDYLTQLTKLVDWEYNVDLSMIASNSQIDIGKSYLKTPSPKDTDWVKGPKDSKVTMIEFSDFECPFCSKFYAWAYKQIVDAYWDKIQIRFKNLPLSFHQKAQKAAESSLCARKQWKFWEMHDKMFENQDKLSVDSYKAWAWEMWMNKDDFAKCIDSWETATEVKAQSDEGAEFWVQWTPAVFINNQFISWAYPFETFKKLIDAELAK